MESSSNCSGIVFTELNSELTIFGYVFTSLTTTVLLSVVVVPV